VPDWAKIPFVPRGLPPAMVFPIGTAKSLAQHGWSLRFGISSPSEGAIRAFVFSFPWRWRGDNANRYEVLARWAYEFSMSAKKRREGVEAEVRSRPDIVLSPHLGEDGWPEPCSEAEADAEPEFFIAPTLDRPAPGEIKRFILLNPSRPKGKPRGKRTKR
jgi:hypothetical protein